MPAFAADCRCLCIYLVHIHFTIYSLLHHLSHEFEAARVGVHAITLETAVAAAAACARVVGCIAAHAAKLARRGCLRRPHGSCEVAGYLGGEAIQLSFVQPILEALGACRAGGHSAAATAHGSEAEQQGRMGEGGAGADTRA
jgi:hypothetical protein